MYQGVHRGRGHSQGRHLAVGIAQLIMTRALTSAGLTITSLFDRAAPNTMRTCRNLYLTVRGHQLCLWNW